MKTSNEHQVRLHNFAISLKILTQVFKVISIEISQWLTRKRIWDPNINTHIKWDKQKQKHWQMNCEKKTVPVSLHSHCFQFSLFCFWCLTYMQHNRNKYFNNIDIYKWKWFSFCARLCEIESGFILLLLLLCGRFPS